ncbi:MAG: endonuclease III, partial [Clostridiales bacterium]|nr:endonuclease III [Clostridiales bacterium]
MPDTEKIQRLLELLDELYPWDAKSFLHYETPWQLLFATILSAQCTDDRVNQVTATLFKKYPSLEAFAAADLQELEKDVHATGFFHMKALHIKQSAGILLSAHGGEMPSDLNALLKLPGVGRKTANLILGHIFQTPSVVVDTHVKRVSYRLGLTRNKDPEKVEYDLMKVLPESHWIRFN